MSPYLLFMNSSTPLHDALHDIIDGRIVKRAKHELRWNGRDITSDFVEALRTNGYLPTLVKDVAIQPGERVPAFCFHDEHAYFGWVFWEKFTDARSRKLFGSVVHNSSGDWGIQISEKRNTVIYVNTSLRSEMDIDNPSGF